MNIAVLLMKGRRTYVGLMQDTCRVFVPGGRGPLDQQTGQHALLPDVVLYPSAGDVADGNPGRCVTKAVSRAVAPIEGEAGGLVVMLRRYEVALPFSAVTPIPEGAVVEVLSVGPTGDPWLVGRRLTVLGATLSSLAVSRQLIVEEAA